VVAAELVQQRFGPPEELLPKFCGGRGNLFYLAKPNQPVDQRTQGLQSLPALRAPVAVVPIGVGLVGARLSHREVQQLMVVQMIPGHR